MLYADAACAKVCNRQVYPQEEPFDDCYHCSSKEVFEQLDLGSIEIVFTINYTRSSLLLGGVQATLATTCVSLLEEEGMKVHYFNFSLTLCLVVFFTLCYMCTTACCELDHGHSCNTS